MLLLPQRYQSQGFNTQPPKGGWKGGYFSLFDHSRFNTQPPKGGWERDYAKFAPNIQFQHTAA